MRYRNPATRQTRRRGRCTRPPGIACRVQRDQGCRAGGRRPAAPSHPRARTGTRTRDHIAIASYLLGQVLPQLRKSGLAAAELEVAEPPGTSAMARVDLTRGPGDPRGRSWARCGQSTRQHWDGCGIRKSSRYAGGYKITACALDGTRYVVDRRSTCAWQAKTEIASLDSRGESKDPPRRQVRRT